MAPKRNDFVDWFRQHEDGYLRDFVIKQQGDWFAIYRKEYKPVSAKLYYKLVEAGFPSLDDARFYGLHYIGR